MRILIVTVRASGMTENILEVPKGSTLGAVLESAGSQPQEGESVTVFNEKASPDAALHDGDRIEICAPLICEPKKARGERAQRDRGQKRSRR